MILGVALGAGIFILMIILIVVIVFVVCRRPIHGPSTTSGPIHGPSIGGGPLYRALIAKVALGSARERRESLQQLQWDSADGVGDWDNADGVGDIDSVAPSHDSHDALATAARGYTLASPTSSVISVPSTTSPITRPASGAASTARLVSSSSSVIVEHASVNARTYGNVPVASAMPPYLMVPGSESSSYGVGGSTSPMHAQSVSAGDGTVTW